MQNKVEIATHQFHSTGFDHWRVGKYRVTTYPDSDLLHIVLAEKTHKRVHGVHIEKMCRDAITAAKERQA